MRASSLAPATGSRWCRTAFPNAMSKLGVVEGEVFAGRDRERRSDRSTPTMAAPLPGDLDAALGQVERRHVGATARQEHGQFAQPAAVLDDLLAAQVTEELGDANEQRVAPWRTRRSPSPSFGGTIGSVVSPACASHLARSMA